MKTSALSLLLIFLSLVPLATPEPLSQLEPQTHPQTPSQQSPSQSPISSYIIIAIGLIVIVLEIIVWQRSRREKSLVAFAVFTKDSMPEFPSQSHSDYQVGKMKVPSEEVMAKDESPGIKTIKAMTQDSSTSERDARKRRKRKADKISDRRSKQVEEADQHQ